IHDAARPFVSAEVIARTLAGLDAAEGTLAAVEIVDTLKRVDGDGRIVETVPRERVHAAQTPQGFRYPAIRAAHARAAEAGRDDFTDDAAVAEWAGLDVRVVAGDPANVKLTTSSDFEKAEARMSLDRFAALADVRVGQGYDVHAFAPGDAVTLCGVSIPHVARLDGHSDADVALHALTDAILGALGDGDIGAHFPPSDAQWRGADSALFLRDALARLAARGGMLAHADVTIVAEAPKIGPHREAMRARLAQICACPIDRIGVKATTNEKLGFVGRREGIAVLAAATIRLPLSD
ncbi:MAG: 2-C-methyl-D-erythritol 2,4-cyclodiphosphate synthase, partial [Phyllobacteriaceae bacterium]|nr:2-C-methyl-D-erythritol 2,4-cyclodiphosphate synthase [Phyllobacteriaceae bacterium]